MCNASGLNVIIAKKNCINFSIEKLMSFPPLQLRWAILFSDSNEGPVHRICSMLRFKDCYLGAEAILPLFRFQSQSHLPGPKLDRLLPERTALTHERSQQF